ncbi:MAG: DUF4260 domain-containing protein [Flavobacteriales bacterium]|nr:DUF4260 domain-containing protein [Flavobacteriales bacterium]
MKNLLRLEELAQFLFCGFWMYFLGVPWWCYLLLLLGPDIGMLGYLVNSRVGSISYNLLHHKGLALVVWMLGMFTVDSMENWSTGWIPGLILFGHASMDRIFGYGLKFGDNFHHTHLGWIGKGVKEQERSQ